MYRCGQFLGFTPLRQVQTWIRFRFSPKSSFLRVDEGIKIQNQPEFNANVTGYQ
jgi:hypothetical protein